MPKLKPGTVLPAVAEDAAITAAALSDENAVPFTDREWALAKPLARLGRPPSAVTKERISIRLSRDVLERFRAGGQGWQTRLDSALKDWLKSHSPD